MQVDPIKPKIKPPGTKRLKLKCDIPLSTSAFKFVLRRYTKAAAAAGGMTKAEKMAAAMAKIELGLAAAAAVEAARARVAEGAAAAAGTAAGGVATVPVVATATKAFNIRKI